MFLGDLDFHHRLLCVDAEEIRREMKIRRGWPKVAWTANTVSDVFEANLERNLNPGRSGREMLDGSHLKRIQSHHRRCGLQTFRLCNDVI